MLDIRKASRDLYAETARGAKEPLGYVNPPDSSDDEFQDDLAFIRRYIREREDTRLGIVLKRRPDDWNLDQQK